VVDADHPVDAELVGEHAQCGVANADAQDFIRWLRAEAEATRRDDAGVVVANPVAARV
jgi:hypothetical protein